MSNDKIEHPSSNFSYEDILKIVRAEVEPLKNKINIMEKALGIDAETQREQKQIESHLILRTYYMSILNITHSFISSMAALGKKVALNDNAIDTGYGLLSAGVRAIPGANIAGADGILEFIRIIISWGNDKYKMEKAELLARWSSISNLPRLVENFARKLTLHRAEQIKNALNQIIHPNSLLIPLVNLEIDKKSLSKIIHEAQSLAENDIKKVIAAIESGEIKVDQKSIGPASQEHDLHAMLGVLDAQVAPAAKFQQSIDKEPLEKKAVHDKAVKKPVRIHLGKNNSHAVHFSAAFWHNGAKTPALKKNLEEKMMPSLESVVQNRSH